MAYETAMKMDSRNGEQSSYFSVLDKNSLENILRHVSTRPHSSRWQAFIDLKDALSVLRSGGPLGALARHSFSSLAMDCFQRTGNSLMFDVSNVVFYDDQDPQCQIFVDLFAELSSTVRTIWVCSTYVRFSRIKDSLNMSINLRCLHLVGDWDFDEMESVLGLCSGKWEVVQFKGKFLSKYTISAIEKHCEGVKEIWLIYPECESSLNAVWACLGQSLESVYIDGANELFDGLAKHCVKVNTIECVTIKPGQERHLVYLCERSGSFLRNIRLDNCLPSWDLQRVANACPRALFDLRLHSHEGEALERLSDCVRTLRVNGSIEQLPESGERAFPNLEELYVRMGPGTLETKSFLERFLPLLTPALRKLSFESFHFDVDYAENMFDVCANYVSTVEVLNAHFNCSRSRGLWAVFRNFAASNRSLKSVNVQCNTWSNLPEKVAEDATVSFVSGFAQCDSLQELVLKTRDLCKMSTRIAEACVPFRGRAVDISLGGCLYLV